MSLRTALIVVDVQNDFIDGSMPLHTYPGGNSGYKVVKSINHLLESVKFDLVVYTQDYHPPNHISFVNEETNTGTWPVHCVEGTRGVELHPELNIKPNSESYFVKKATGVYFDSYSAFGNLDSDDKNQITDLKEKLLDSKIDMVFLCGLTREYCVWETAKHSARFFPSFILDDCVGAVYEPGYQDQTHEGVTWITTNQLIESSTKYGVKLIK